MAEQTAPDSSRPRTRGRAVRAVIASVLAMTLTVALALSSSCYSHSSETTCGQESEPLVPLHGRIVGDQVVVDDAGLPVLDDAGFIIPVLQTLPDGGLVTNAQGDPVIAGGPQPQTTVLVELCQLYGENPDPSRAHPNYRYATVTRDDGTFDLMVPKGKIGIHTFREGWFYGRIEVKDSPDRIVDNPPLIVLAARGSKGLVLSKLTVSPIVASPNETLAFSVNVQHADTDPASEEIIVFEPESTLARAFAPPSRGHPSQEFGGRSGWPDGTYTALIAAPAKPGTYTYYAHATSEHCVSSNKLSLQIVVK